MLPSQFCVNFPFSFSWIGLYYNKLILNEQSSWTRFCSILGAERSCLKITPLTGLHLTQTQPWTWMNCDFQNCGLSECIIWRYFCYPWHLSKPQGFFSPSLFHTEHVRSFPSSTGGLEMNNVAVETKSFNKKLFSPLSLGVLETVYTLNDLLFIAQYRQQDIKQYSYCILTFSKATHVSCKHCIIKS